MSILLPFAAHIFAFEVSGRILSSEDEEPLAGIEVKALADSTIVLFTKTDHNGYFSIEINDSSRTAYISIALSGYASMSYNVVNPKESVDLGNIMLSPLVILDELSVTASDLGIIHLADKNIIIPTSLEKERATNPLSLLTQLSFKDPILKIDENAKTISIDGSTPAILINGIRRTYADFNVLDPKKVIKVEYITHPDIRYGAPYINIVSERPTSGGNMLADLSAAMTTRKESHQVAESYFKGKNIFSLSYSGIYRNGRHEFENENQSYLAPGHSYVYSMIGHPSNTLDREHSITMDYSWVASPTKAFVATLNLDIHDNSSHRVQGIVNFSDKFDRFTDLKLKKCNPSLNLYSSLPILGFDRLEICLSAGFQSGNYDDALSQTDGYLQSVHTKNRSGIVAAELYYEHPLSWGMLNIGASQQWRQANNRYTLINNAHQSLTQTKTTSELYASLSSQAFKCFDYFVSVGATCNNISKISIDPYIFTLLQRRVAKVSLQYALQVKSFSAGFYDYNEALLPVNELMYVCGNPSLKIRKEISNEISTSYRMRQFSFNLSLEHSTESNTPVTVVKYVNDAASPIFGKFLQEKENGGSMNKYGASLSIGLSNILGRFSIQASGSWRHESVSSSGMKWLNRGFTSQAYASVYFSNWQVFASGCFLKHSSMMGNAIWTQYPYWSVGASYRYRSWSFVLRASDIFNKKAGRNAFVINAGQYSSKRDYWMADLNNLVSLTIRFQMDFGDSKQQLNRHLSGNTQIDSSVGGM